MCPVTCVHDVCVYISFFSSTEHCFLWMFVCLCVYLNSLALAVAQSAQLRGEGEGEGEGESKDIELHMWPSSCWCCERNAPREVPTAAHSVHEMHCHVLTRFIYHPLQPCHQRVRRFVVDFRSSQLFEWVQWKYRIQMKSQVPRHRHVHRRWVLYFIVWEREALVRVFVNPITLFWCTLIFSWIY